MLQLIEVDRFVLISRSFGRSLAAGPGDLHGYLGLGLKRRRGLNSMLMLMLQFDTDGDSIGLIVASWAVVQRSVYIFIAFEAEYLFALCALKLQIIARDETMKTRKTVRNR